MPISRLSVTSCVGLEPRPLPSTGVTRGQRYYGPLRHPRRPGLSLAGVRLRVTRPHRLGFPVLRWISMYRHAVVITPVARWVLIARGTAYSTRFPFIPSDGGLPHPSARSASTLVVSRPAQRSLALRPVGLLRRQSDTSFSKAPSVRYLHPRSDSYRMERSSCRVGIAPTEDQHLFTAHTRSDLTLPLEEEARWGTAFEITPASPGSDRTYESQEQDDH